MLQPPDVLSSSLFVDSSLIESLECAICTNVLNDPAQCRNGHGFCRNCLEEAMKTKEQCPTCKVALSSTTIGSNLIAKNLIENAQVYCFTRLEALEAANTSTSSNAVTDVDADDDGDVDEAAGKKRSRAVPAGSGSSSSSSSGAATKRAKADHCMWIGKLCGAKQHFNICEYAGALCGFGCGTVVRRIDMLEHESSFCPKREVKCTNVGCTVVMPETKIAAHKANDCLYELVDCPFSSVGCKERVLRKDIESHEEATMKQHNRLLLQDIRSLRQDNRSLRQDIQSLRQDDIQSLRKDNLSLHQKVAEQKEQTTRQLYQIVYKVKLDDLLQDGIVNMYSVDKAVGAYKAFLSVGKGNDHNGDCCGVHLHLASRSFSLSCIFHL